jgi:sialate O-acetylesterase
MMVRKGAVSMKVPLGSCRQKITEDIRINTIPTGLSGIMCLIALLKNDQYMEKRGLISKLTANSMKNILLYTIVFALTTAGEVSASTENLSLLISLKGAWSFTIGINNEWVSPKYDDSDWETVKVPSSWENQGFNGYNGYAFYRKKITIPSGYKGRMLYLYMGYIDDVDEVYLNGHKIGSTGGFPPNYVTAYNAERIYYIPEQYINFDGLNLITVKVYDSQLEGGIVSGEVGLYGGKTSLKFDVNLQTSWKFKPGDDLRQKAIEFDDKSWDDVFVPAKWEDQGYRDYDGYAWYRKSFIFQGSDPDDRMVVMLGKIDDIDQVYINGILVGSTGNLPAKPNIRVSTGEEYKALRGYYLPVGLLKKGQKNVIAIRVLDTGGEGGIYEGPVGIITQTKYIEYWKKNKKTGN